MAVRQLIQGLFNWGFDPIFLVRNIVCCRHREEVKSKRTSEDCLISSVVLLLLPNLFLRLFYTSSSLTQLLALIFGWASFGSFKFSWSPGVGKGNKEQPSSESPQQVPTLTDRTFAGVIATSNDQIMQFHEEKVYRIYGPTFSMAFPTRNEESHLLIPDRFLPARTAVAVLLYSYTLLYRLQYYNECTTFIRTAYSTVSSFPHLARLEKPICVLF